MGESQFGFRIGFGAKNAIFALLVLIRDPHKEVYFCFIDLSRAFDSVTHELLILILGKAGLDNQDIKSQSLLG